MARHTPLDYANLASQLSNGEIYMKLENTQKNGSFKIRGVSNKVAKMVEEGDFSPVIASSAGNHAQGVACAATKLGIKSTIVMPATAPIAAVISGKIDVAGKKVVCIISGGNIDVSLIDRLISRGLSVRGRIADIWVVVPTKAGAVNHVLDLTTETCNAVWTLEDFVNIN